MDTLRTATGADREALASLLSHAFAFEPELSVPWFERAGHDHVWAFDVDGALAGGLIVIPMGQHFGGRAVPMTGIAGVGVAPEFRGRGAGTRMMREAVRALHREGAALSTLYPATVPLYERAGWARAGLLVGTAVRPHDLDATHDPSLRVRPLADLDAPALRALQSSHARLRNGSLARGPYIWTRLAKPMKGAPRYFAVEGSEGIEGYVVLLHQERDGHDTEVIVTDAAIATPRAARAIVAVLASYRSLAQQVRWTGAPHDMLTQLLRDRMHTVTVREVWMLRVVDVPRALAARGYNAHLCASIAFAVADDVVPENARTWRLTVEGGVGAVTPDDGTPDVSLDVRALAPLYTGFRSATTLAAAGLAQGEPAARALADLLVAGESPAMIEIF